MAPAQHLHTGPAAGGPTSAHESVATSPDSRSDCPVNGPCGGTGIQIHPAWVAFYLRIETEPFPDSVAVNAWWREQNCPTDHSGRLILPPEEIPCVCTVRARVAA